jgi:hypothetical protein
MVQKLFGFYHFYISRPEVFHALVDLFQIEHVVVVELLAHIDIHRRVVTVLEARPGFPLRQFDPCTALARLRE